MASGKKSSKNIIFKRIVIALVICAGLEYVPGKYTIDDFEDDYEIGSPEGIALLALSDAQVDGKLYFKEAARHRISRNAEIVIPADTYLTLHATTHPYVEADEVILRPSSLVLRSDRALTFIYRFVTVARAKTMRIHPEDPEQRVQAIGQYRIISALCTAYRYQRQKEVRREYKIPNWAQLDFDANFLADHELKTAQGYALSTGSTPGHLKIQNAVWIQNRWQSGSLDLRLPFSDLEPLVNKLLFFEFPENLELGSTLDIQLFKIYDILFNENNLELNVDGKLNYAKSSKVTNVFHPSFKAKLGIAFEFPQNQLLQDAQMGVYLSNVYSLDFNRSNLVFDKIARKLVRKHRKDASYFVKLIDEFPEIMTLPGQLFIEKMMLSGDENGYPHFECLFQILPENSESFTVLEKNE
ncbi:hypothetical protein P3T73_01840 [Kiritimatiellota bacterium B12222]|nr:hypothetical protein P3T73_01840 [Kiritimatiellota bacterium B12222]